MGYTHYLRNKRAFTDAEWKALTEDVKKLIANCGVPIGNGHGDAGSSPVFNNRHIMFNGIGDDSHETALVKKDASSFEFCKTARKPYDKVVVEFYKLIRKYDPKVILSSDGGDEIFDKDMSKIKINDKWTYFVGSHDVKVGDKVILPPTPYSDGKNWEGIVTAIGSSFTGSCKTILGIVPEPVPTPVSLEGKITEYLANEFSLNTKSAKFGAQGVLKIIQAHLRS